MMERRGFLRGFVGAVAAGKLILEATDADIETFGVKTGQNTILQHGQLASIPNLTGQEWDQIGSMYLLYNCHGEAVAMVQSYQQHLRQNPVNISNWQDETPRFIAGLLTSEIVCRTLEPQCNRWVQECAERQSLNIRNDLRRK